ncbi:MAG: DUF2007 domain-containing protein [Deltaproteobacteria bacterium]|nr:DUF2007 domain-containing protein [Deltaproteobacteria bacterium]
MEEPADRCGSCGAALLAECVACGAAVEPTVRMCPACGADRHEDHFRASSPEMGVPPPIAPTAYPLFRASFPLAIAGVFMLGALAYLRQEGRVDTTYVIVAAGIFVFLLLLFLGSFARRRREGTVMADPPSKSAPRGQVEIYRSLNLGRAEHLLSLLRSEDIPAIIANRHSATLEPMSLLTGVRVMVPAAHEGEAREIMAAFSFRDSEE